MTIATAVDKAKRALGMSVLPELSQELLEKERIFRAPPFTKELVSAIKLIAPQFKLRANETCRIFWEADQNGSCWGEYIALKPLFDAMPHPSKVLEIGPGLGRSLVFFTKLQCWQSCALHAYEGDGTSTRYAILGPRMENSWCGNISMLEHVLEYNQIKNVRILNSADYSIKELPEKYDFVYGFYTIGFHWSLEYFLDDILEILHDDSVAVFSIPNNFEPFPHLEKLSYRIIDWKVVWPQDTSLKMLIFAKDQLPTF